MKLELREICKSYGDHVVLDSVSLKSEAARVLVLIGPSGGGKSTLLRLMAGLEAADKGQMLVNGRPVPSREKELLAYRRTIGVVFQAFNLFPHLTAIENIELPLLKVHGYSAKKARDRAMELLERLHLSDRGGQPPAKLSGGQRQRVAIARALAIRPQVLFLDEPTSSLDPEMTGEVLEVIEELKAEGRDLVLVTHEMGFARKVADEAVFLAGGRILEAGPAAALFSNPETGECRRFLEKVLRY
jgi:polar amino acid transport system ATP-binding protein